MNGPVWELITKNLGRNKKKLKNINNKKLKNLGKIDLTIK